MTIERRDFLRLAAGTLAASPWLGRAADAAPAKPGGGHDMSAMPPGWTGHEQIGMLLYPGFTALDFVAPQYLFAGLMGAKVHHIARTMEPVSSDTQLALVPTSTFEQAPAELDILFVPGGGEGTIAAMQDRTLLAFVADRGSRAKWVTSVCTGSLVLGAAGLLKGYRATSHWVVRELLAEVGAIPVDARVVRDRNRITGAGVSAGLDLGLTIVGMLRDQAYAETLQLLAEYAPEPPFSSGSPHTAPPMVKATLEDMFKDFGAVARLALDNKATS